MSDLLACPECHETGVVDYRGAAAKCPTCKGAKRIADRRIGKDRRATPSAEQKVKAGALVSDFDSRWPIQNPAARNYLLGMFLAALASSDR